MQPHTLEAFAGALKIVVGIIANEGIDAVEVKRGHIPGSVSIRFQRRELRCDREVFYDDLELNYEKNEVLSKTIQSLLGNLNYAN